MKYYEQIKSIVLLLLVALSLFLTFRIWSYQPNYKIIEENQVVAKKIGKYKEIDQILLPYRLIVSENDKLYGNVSYKKLNEIMSTMSSWKPKGLDFEKNNLTYDDINNFISENKHITLFYSAEVPIKVFQSILNFSDSDITNITFDRLIIDWGNLNDSNIKINFINTKNKTLYSTKVPIKESDFQDDVLRHLEDLDLYQEVKRIKKLSLYVPTEQVKLNQYTYYIDEVSPDMFRDILFNDPNIVKKNNESEDSLKYTDGMALMTVDTNSRIFNFVNPSSENISNISLAELWNNTFQFVNNHGGFNGDYRYASVNMEKHVIDYQLFMHGYPVFSSITSTQITATWGNNQIFRYKRPYFFLEMDISSEKKSELLHSGAKIIELVDETNKLQLSSIDDLVVGYYLVQNDNDLLYTLVPSWFAIIKGSWIRLSPQILGGVEYGLE